MIFDVGLALKRALIQEGVTQRELANKIGISECRISRLLNQTGDSVTVKTLMKLAKALDYDFYVFVGLGSNEPPMATYVAHTIKERCGFVFTAMGYKESHREEWDSVAPYSWCAR